MKKFATIPTLKKIDEDARTIEHVISTGSEDRDGDTIDPKGWILDEFLKNPVVLFGHRHDVPPIARAVKLKASENGLETLTLFPPKGISQVSDTVFDLNRLGFLRSWSVGFDPVKFTQQDNGGIAFEEQKLLEYSSVPVPANPDAVNLAVSKGIMTDKMLELFEWHKGSEWGYFGDGTIAKIIQKGPTQFADLPILEEAWNPRGVSDADLQNAILGVAPGEDFPDDPDTLNWDAFRKVHLWWDPDAFDAADSAQGKKDAFKLKIGRRDPITDTDAPLKVFFQQLASRVAILNGARGGVDIPEADREGAYNHAVKYYDKLPDKEPPPLKALDIDGEKLQSCFDNGIAALRISSADHARYLKPGKTIRV
jgi:HK97 family phage prohead protease